MPGVASAANLGKLVPMRTRAVWALRALWFLLPLTVGQAASDAIASADHAVPQVMTIGLGVLWAGGMVASMVPVPITLTGLRIFAAGIAPVALWTMFDTNFSAISIIAGVHAIATGFVALNPLIGDRFIDGGSYGDERRMALRPPAQVGYFLVPFVWALMAASTATGPLLLANKQWIAGVLTTAVGAGVVAIGARAVHQLTQRWVVFVPTGLVLHDQMVVIEPVLFRRTAIERVGAAIAGSPARDLSNRAAGLLLECELTDPAPLALRDPNAIATAEQAEVRRFLFCPTRPGEFLNEAERRNIPTD